MIANKKMPMLHNEGLTTRNYTSYNFEVLRDDIYMLGIDGTVTKHRIAPTRSTCAVVVSSQNANRDWLYYMQQTVSAEGFSGFAFSPYYPHTVRATETKTCTDCHVSARWRQQCLDGAATDAGHQPGEFHGALCLRGGGIQRIRRGSGGRARRSAGGLRQRSPQAGLFRTTTKSCRSIMASWKKRTIKEGNVLDVQLRGEYLYAAMGKGGFRVFDVANIDNKNFSEKMTTAPVSPLGQRFYVKTKFATAVGSPSTLAVDPLRQHIPANEEQRHCAVLRLPLRDGSRGRFGGDRRSESEEQEPRRADAAGRKSRE